MAPLKIACALCVSAALLFAAALMDRKVTWFLMVPSARIKTDGVPPHGSLYRDLHGTSMILVLRNGKKSQAYWIALPDKRPGSVILCDDWAPTRLPAFAVGKTNPPCLGSTAAAPDSPPPGYVIRNGFDFVALVLYKREVVRVEWQ
jgi:hypothetical protein